MRILILSANTGEGHNSAARAIEEYLTLRGDTSLIVDALSYLGASSNEIICKGHVFLYRSLPKLYGIGYRFEEQYYLRQRYQKKKSRRTSVVKQSKQKHSLRALLSTNGFDAVICVHVFAARMVTNMRLKHNINIPAFFLATDYTCSPGVNQLDMDAWLIPHENLIDTFAAYGIPREKLIPTGIPVKGVFSHTWDKQQARRELNLPPDRRIAVLSCGSMGAGPMERMVLSIAQELQPDMLLVAICGNNHRLEANLRAQCDDNMLRVIGYTQRMHLYMAASDLFLTKPGGLSITEAATLRTPMLMYNAVPGCETRNMEFFTANNCAYGISSISKLPSEVIKLLKVNNKLAKLAINCANKFSGSAVERIYNVIAKHSSNTK